MTGFRIEEKGNLKSIEFSLAGMGNALIIDISDKGGYFLYKFLTVKGCQIHDVARKTAI